ncbi:MAG: hypothetical protein JST15_02220 [Bacteroidetes bacterium]|nr:hypothetical protein [Bacteroidota bacterium]
MKTEETEKSASKKFNLGNYLSAERQFKELLNNSKDFEDKTYFRNKIADCKEYREIVMNLSAGEAFFPVFDQAGNNSSVLTIRITDNPTGTKTFDIKKIKEAVIKFLDDYLYQEVKTIMVLDWKKIEDYKAEIKNIPNLNDDFREFTESIEGRSFELAAAIALISKILDLKISPDFVFSGNIEDAGTSVILKPVNRIKEKLDCIKAERPDMKKFIVPSGLKISDKIISKKNSLKNVVSEVFSKFDKDLEKSLFENKFVEKITLKINTSKIKNRKAVSVFNFIHPNIQEKDIKRISEYLFNTGSFIKNIKQGIVIDGLKVAYLSPMLLSMSNVTNHISNFVAVRFGPPEGNNAKAAVVRTNNSNTSKYKVGDTFSYKISQK